MKKYWRAYLISLQETLQRRSSLVMDRLGGIAVMLSLYYFWKTLLLGRTSFLGYSYSQMLTYVLGMNILRSFALTGRGWELVGEISSGKISSYLVRPLSYHGYALALDLSQKTVHLFAAFFEIGALLIFFHPPFYWPKSILSLFLFAGALLTASLLFFFLEFIVSSLAFWTSESGGPLFFFELFIQFAAGAFFPLDVLPRFLQKVLSLSPFPYLVFLPINIYLGRVGEGRAFQDLLISFVWTAVFGATSVYVWRKGLLSYSAEGG